MTDLEELDRRIAAILPRYQRALEILEARKRRKAGFWLGSAPGYCHIPEDDLPSSN